MVYSQQPTAVPWTSTDWGGSESPRRRHSPRRRQHVATGSKSREAPASTGKGAHKGKGKADGGKKKSDLTSRLEPPPGVWSAPTLAETPQPPEPPTSSSRPSTAALVPPASAEKSALDNLVQALAAKREDLPSSIQELLEAHQQEATMGRAKLLHRAVSAQQKAQTELGKVRSARLQFLNGWHQYLCQLGDLLAQQTEAQTTALADFDAQELQWANALQEADRTLQERVATGSVDEQSVDTGMDGQESATDQSEAKVAETIALEQSLQQQREQHQAAAQSLLQAVQAAKDKAGSDAAAAAARERDRTPRRKRAENKPDIEGPIIDLESDAVPGKALS